MYTASIFLLILVYFRGLRLYCRYTICISFFFSSHTTKSQAFYQAIKKLVKAV